MLAWFVDNTLAAAVLAVLVLVICRLVRFRPAVQHALWLLVLLRLLVPPGICWPWSPWVFCADWAGAETGPALAAGHSPERVAPPGGTVGPALEQRPAPEHTIGGTQFIPSEGTEALSAQTSISPHARLRLPDDPSVPEPSRSSRGAWLAWCQAACLTALWYLWAAGAVVMLLLQIVRGARFHRLVVRGSTPPRWFTDELDRLAGRLGIRPPRSSVVADLGCPVVWCLGRARLLWPAELVDQFDVERARGVLVHELAHLRRRDHWVIWLEMVAACLWWWNPLFWYVRRRIRHCAELACDAWVVWALPEGRRTYAESLIDVLQKTSRNRAVAPAWGAIGETRRYFERRLTMIYQEKVRRRLSRGGLLAIGLLALVVLPGWSQGPLVGQEAEAPPGETASESPSAIAAEEEPQGEPRPAASAEARATEQIFTPIRASQLAPLSESGVLIPAGYRVVSVPLDEASATRDLVRPGDWTDVLFTPRDEEDAAETKPHTILEEIRVFAVEEEPASSHDERCVSLLVTPQQAEKLAMAAESGRIDLAQRPSTGPPQRPQPPQKTIEVFRLKHRDPAEMMEIVTALWRLVLIVSREDFPAREVAVLAVVKTPVRGSGRYSGGGGMYGGGMPMGPMGGGMMPGGMYGGDEGEEGGYGMDMGDMMGMYPGQGSKARDLPELYLTVDRRTNALIARASQEAMEILRMLVAALDTPDHSLPAQIEKLPSLRLVKFRHRTTEDMIRVLRELGINVQVTQVPLREGDAIFGQGGGTLIAAGDRADLDQIEQLIQALDVESGKGKSAAGGFGAPSLPGAGAPSRD